MYKKEKYCMHDTYNRVILWLLNQEQNSEVPKLSWTQLSEPSPPGKAISCWA